MYPRFHHDLGQEQLLQPFLDRSYAAYGIRVKRYSDPELQCKGVDAILSKGKTSFLVDEKAQLHYIGKCLPTCAFEVEVLRNRQPHTGWFLDPSKSTEVYALVCEIRLHTHRCQIHRADDVASAEVILVNRKRLIELLAKNGVTKDLLLFAAKQLRVSGERKIDIAYPGVRLVQSKHLKEQPINLLVTRQVLRSIGQVMNL